MTKKKRLGYGDNDGGGGRPHPRSPKYAGVCKLIMSVAIVPLRSVWKVHLDNNMFYLFFSDGMFFYYRIL